MKSFYFLLMGLGITAVVGELSIVNFKVGVLAKDQEPNNENLKHVSIFSKLPDSLKADSSQRLYMSFDILKKSEKSKVQPQQVFLRFEAENGEDAIFAVNPDASGHYVHDTVLRSSNKPLRSSTGKLKTNLIVGDAALKSPVNWNFADIDINYSVQPESIPKSQQIFYEPREEIAHIFRQPENRPPVVISDLFTVICLSPLVLLVGLWSQIGINFENTPASPWVPLFHIGLTGIFGLYFLFWVQLDMFETLKFLAFFGFVTFVAGNRVLRALSGDKIKSE